MFMLQPILGLCYLFIILFFVVGIFSPSSVIVSRPNPSRWRVLLYTVIGFSITSVLVSLFVDLEEVNKDHLTSAKEQIELGNYTNALDELNEIGEASGLFIEAQQIKSEVDSIKFAIYKSNFKKEIKQDLESVKKGIDFAAYYKKTTGAASALSMFSEKAKMIKEAQSHGDPEVVAMGLSLKKEMIRQQKIGFPALRKEFGKQSNSNLWESDISVSVGGKNNATITYTGAIFTTNRNIKDFHETILLLLTRFRYKRVIYRWYEGQEDYTYWSINSHDDAFIFVD